MEELQEQSENRHKIIENLKEKEARDKAAHLAPWQFKKGQSGNPNGRTPGRSVKERAKIMLQSMTDEEFEEFLHGIDKRTVWEMAEGKADSKTDITTDGEKINFGVVILPQKNGTEDTLGTTA